MKKERGYFANLNSGMLVATFFALWLAVYFENTVENTLGYILILSFGILHGANDIKLLQVTNKKEGKKLKYGYILLYYVAFVLLVAGLFYFIPAISLAFFIVFSAYHFGEQHWVTHFHKERWKDITFYTSYGLVILFLMFAAHASEVSSIIFRITGFEVQDDFYFKGLLGSGIPFVVLYIYNIKQNTANTFIEAFYILVFFIVFNTASLLWSFAIYFIIWHSIPSLKDQINYLYGDFNKEYFIKYLMSSIIYWGISVIALILLFLFI